MNRIQTTSKLPMILSGLFLSLLVGCSHDGDPTNPAEPGELSFVAGTIAVNLSADADTGSTELKSEPGVQATYDDLILVLRGVSAHRASGDTLDGWYGLEFEPTEYSFQDLSTGLSGLIAEARLPVGTYNQIRLLLGEGSHVIVDGEEILLSIPSGLRSGIKIRHLFEIVDGETYAATLGFDTTRSVRVTSSGEYVLKPRIRIVESIASRLAGAIIGVVNPAEAEATVWVDTSDGKTTAVADPVTGEFLLPALAAGTYTVNFTPAADSWYPSISLMGIEVVGGETTDLGTIQLMMPMK